jgi:hypothetical protein
MRYFTPNIMIKDIAYRVYNKDQILKAITEAKSQGINVSLDFVDQVLNSGYLRTSGLCVIYRQLPTEKRLHYADVENFHRRYIKIVDFVTFKDYYQCLKEE